MISLSGSHSVSYLIMLVNNKVPMDTYYAFQDSEKKKTTVMNSSFEVDNFSASSFLNATGKVAKLSSKILHNRPSGITFPDLIS